MKFAALRWFNKSPIIELEEDEHHVTTHIEYPKLEENEYSDYDLFDEETNELQNKE